MENQTPSSHLDSLQNVGARIEHQHHRRTGTVDKIYDEQRKRNYIYSKISYIRPMIANGSCSLFWRTHLSFSLSLLLIDLILLILV